MASVKLLQVVWNFPATVARPFDMYYFYWPVYEAVQRGWQAEVLTFQIQPDQAAEETIDGIHVRRCPAGVRKGRPFSWPFISALLTTDADIIYCHGYGEGRSELALLLGRLRGRKVVFAPYFHTYPYHRPLRENYDKTLGRLFCNLSHRVIVSTDYTARALAALGVPDEQITVIPHVARPEVFSLEDAACPQTTDNLIQQAGIQGSPLILGVGQLIERKGWEYTVRCLPAIIAYFPDAVLLLIGPSQPAEPAFRVRLLQLAYDLGVLDHVCILQDNPPAFIRAAYQAATLLTHPSCVESFGLVVLEALTAGVPVVVNRATGLPCIVDDGVTGYVVDVRDIKAYTQALLTLLQDPALREQMGAAGQQQAVSRFGQPEVAAQLFTVFAELLNTTTMPAQKIAAEV